MKLKALTVRTAMFFNELNDKVNHTQRDVTKDFSSLPVTCVCMYLVSPSHRALTQITITTPLSLLGADRVRLVLSEVTRRGWGQFCVFVQESRDSCLSHVHTRNLSVSLSQLFDQESIGNFRNRNSAGQVSYSIEVVN